MCSGYGWRHNRGNSEYNFQEKASKRKKDRAQTLPQWFSTNWHVVCTTELQLSRHKQKQENGNLTLSAKIQDNSFVPTIYRTLKKHTALWALQASENCVYTYCMHDSALLSCLKHNTNVYFIVTTVHMIADQWNEIQINIPVHSCMVRTR